MDSSPEVYSSFFNITAENNNAESYIFPGSNKRGVTYQKVRKEIEKDLKVSDCAHPDLQDGTLGQSTIEGCEKEVTRRLNDEAYLNLLAGYTSSIYQDIKGHLRTEVDLVEDDIRLVLDENFSNFITYELTPGTYTFEDLSDVFVGSLQSD